MNFSYVCPPLLGLQYFSLCTTNNLAKTPLFVAAEVILLIFLKAKFEAVEGKTVMSLRIKSYINSLAPGFINNYEHLDTLKAVLQHKRGNLCATKF